MSEATEPIEEPAAEHSTARSETDRVSDAEPRTLADAYRRSARAQNPPPGYRSAGSERPGPEPLPRSWPSPTRILTLADIHVGRFARRPDIALDLPQSLAACTYLMNQCGYLAMTAMRRTWEIDAQDEDEWDRSVDPLQVDFGPHVEAVMAQHADLILEFWWAERRMRGVL